MSDPPSSSSSSPSEKLYSIELYFDPALENQILKAWNVLARRQITNHLMTISSRPHITLISSPSLSPSHLRHLLKALAPSLPPLPLTLSTISTSPLSPSSLSFLPLPTSSLLSLHSSVVDALRNDGVLAAEGFRVDGWMPEVVVAEGVGKGRVAEAFCVLKELKMPVSGYCVDVGVVEFESNVREVFTFPLGVPAAAGNDGSSSNNYNNNDG